MEAHLLISLAKAYRPRVDYYKQLVRSGLQDKWQKSFPVDDRMAEAILQFLRARCPESIPDFLSDLSQAQAEALARYQIQAAAQLRAYLATLKQGHAALNAMLSDGLVASSAGADASARPLASASDLQAGPSQELRPASSTPSPSWKHFKVRAKLKPEDLIPRMALEIFISEEAYQGRIPLARFVRRVLQGGRRPLLIYVKPLKYRPSHVQSSFFRRGWGIFRDGRVISLGFNWHYRWPGLVRLAGSRPAPAFKREAAHEFGHTMGLSDAYAAWYRSYEAYPGSENYLMHSNRELSPEEIRMMFQAQASGHLQHFPYKWSWKKFRQGFRRELERRAARMSSADRKNK